jgi:hypothetical protein
MSMSRFVLPLVVSAFLLAPAGSARADLVFNFQFDNSGGGPDGTVTPPFVGTGTLSLVNDPGNGTFTLSSLGAFTMSFVFGTATFTQANIVSDLTMTLVVITPFGADRRVYFTDPGAGGGGPFGGSLDLINGSDIMSFEPSYVGGHNLYFEGSNFQIDNFGNYLGVAPGPAVPEPATITLLGLGGVGLLGYRWRRRKLVAA